MRIMCKKEICTSFPVDSKHVGKCQIDFNNLFAGVVSVELRKVDNQFILCIKCDGTEYIAGLVGKCLCEE